MFRIAAESSALRKPVFAFAFANDGSSGARHLAALDTEHAALQQVFGRTDAPWEFIQSAQTSVGGLLDLLQNTDYHGRIALLHFAGHASGSALLMQGDDGSPEIANADAVAEFVALHPGLGFVFLNACSTAGQVEALLKAGVPAIIATDFDVNDAVATEFAGRFYREVVNGSTLRHAFDSASAAVRANDRLKLAASTREIVGVPHRRPPGEWPWRLHVRAGNAGAEQWNIGRALDDPLFGIPSPPEIQLPDAPYRHLLPFEPQHEPIFFGRRRETREIYDAITRGDACRIVLLHGASGTGKSSLFEAGLLPRLQCVRAVEYLRRDPTLTLRGCIERALGASTDADLTARWKEREEEEQRPLTIIMDQLEEALTDPSRDGRAELEELMVALKGVMDRAEPPRGSIVLGFRKEWLSEIQDHVKNQGLAFAAVFLDRLSEAGLREAIVGIPRTRLLREHYKLSIPEDDDELVHDIAGDIVRDASSALAPTLQVLLSKMWDAAVPDGDGSRAFTRELYARLIKDGALLDDFVNQQIARLHDADPEAENSGLVLDLLMLHVSDLGDATRSVQRSERLDRYPAELHERVERLAQLACELQLFTSLEETGVPSNGMGTSRLAHDTLASYIRSRGARSVKPVQRALRVLEERAAEWHKTRRLLDDADLHIVEAARPFMRRIEPDERELLAASAAEVARAARRARRLRQFFVGTGIVVTGLGAAAWWLGHLAQLEARRMVVAGIVQTAGRQADPVVSALMLASVRPDDDVPHGAIQAAIDVLAEPQPSSVLRTGGSAVKSATMSPDGVTVAAGTADGTVWLYRADGRGTPRRLHGHRRAVVRLSFNHDGRWLVSASSDSSAIVWPTLGGDSVVLRGHTDSLTTAAFAPRGERVVTASYDGTALVWSGQRWTRSTVLRHRGPVYDARFDRAGRRVVTASGDSTARVWTLSEGGTVETSVRLAGHNDLVFRAAFDDGGTRVVTASYDSTAIVWAVNGHVLKTLKGHVNAVQSAAFSPDGASIVTASADGTVIVWPSTGAGNSLVLRGHGASVYDATFSRDGALVVSAAVDNAARTWRVDTAGRGKSRMRLLEAKVLRGHAQGVTAASFSPDGSRLITASYDGSVRVWPAYGPSPRLFAAHSDSILSVAFSPDSTAVRFATGSADHTVRLWSVDSLSPLRTLTGHRGSVWSVGFSPDARKLVSGSIDGSAIIWNLDSDQSARLEHRGPVFAASFNPADRGATLATGSEDGTVGTVMIWSTETGRGRVLDRLRGAVHRALFDSAGRRLLATSDSGDVVLWNTRDWSRDTLLRLETNLFNSQKIRAAAFSPLGDYVAAGGFDGSERVWLVRDRKGVRTIFNQRAEAAIRSVAFSHDGTRLASSGNDYNAIVQYIGDSAKYVTMVGHTKEVRTVAFSPDDSALLTASDDGTARLWWADTTRSAIVLSSHSGPVRIGAFAPDGRVLTASEDGTVRLWEVRWPELLKMLKQLTTACLRADERSRLLGEKRSTAVAEATACDRAFGR